MYSRTDRIAPCRTGQAWRTSTRPLSIRSGSGIAEHCSREVFLHGPDRRTGKYTALLPVPAPLSVLQIAHFMEQTRGSGDYTERGSQVVDFVPDRADWTRFLGRSINQARSTGGSAGSGQGSAAVIPSHSVYCIPQAAPVKKAGSLSRLCIFKIVYLCILLHNYNCIM